MAAEVKKKISASSARSHTRHSKPKSSSTFSSGIFFLLVFFTGFLAWAYQAACPPTPNKVGPPDGLPITTPRIKLRDGRYLSYKEYGVPKESAKYKIIYAHGFDSVKHYTVIATSASRALIEELGIYIVSFDRPGYGESDPDPKRTLKSLALDTEELADQLELGSKFYVVGFSMGGQVVWSYLKYIPHRLAGATLIAPVVNYWWPRLPSNLSQQAFSKQFLRDQWSLRVAHHSPSLTYWWNTQKWFPSLTVIAHSPDILSHQDRELKPIFTAGRAGVEEQVRQQGEYESIHHDLNIGFGTWEFDPTEIENPFPENKGSVHIWQGDEDILVPVTLQRYIAQQLPWIDYHELTGAGHMFPYAEGNGDAILKALLLGQNQTITMAGEVKRKISGIFMKFLLVFFTALLAWAYQAACPPAPNKVGPPDGLPITTPRIKLRDGRYLSYKEYGVPKESAKYKIIYAHGFDSVKHYTVIATSASRALIEDLGIYIVSFDRPGYGESDPDPKQTSKSLALDTEELADQLELESKFYVVGYSMGGKAIWSYLKYIPHRNK